MTDFGLKGKVALVTGAARGLGRCIATRFLESGATVVITDINKELGVKTTAELSEMGQVSFVPQDVTDEADVKRVIDLVVDKYGRLDCLVNNAALVSGDRICLAGEKLDYFKRSFAVDVNGTFLCMKYAIEQMLKQKEGGAIVNISSTTAVIATKGMAAYSAAKAAVNSLTQVAAAEYAGDGIRVNAVMPGAMNTESMDLLRKNSPKEYQEVADNIPMKRLADPMEVAQAVVFLCSPDASYITGDCIFVDGGQYVNNIN